MEKLTDKQRRFCEEYLVDLNATQAAIRAGYSEKTAGSVGHENLKKPEIEAFISVLQKKLSEKTGITAEKVIAELAKIGFNNIQDFIKDGNEIKDLSKIDRDLAVPISSIKVTETSGDGWEKTTTEFKLHDKVSALEKLGRHLGVFEKDNKQRSDVKLTVSDTPFTLKTKGNEEGKKP